MSTSALEASTGPAAPRDGLPCPPALQRAWTTLVTDELITVLRHDLRNKLAAVRNAAFYLRRKTEANAHLVPADPRTGQFFQLIDSELDSCTGLLGARLPGVSARSATPDPVDAARCARELVEALAPVPGISVSLEAGPEVLVAAGPEQLQAVLFALVENAVDAVSLRGSGTVRVTIGTDGGRVVLAVEDDGPGLGPLSPEEVQRPSFSTRPGRLGLGLKISKRIATRLGGRLTLVARSGSGCRATLELPEVTR